MTIVTINHGSYQVESFKTELVVNESYIQFKLARLIEDYYGEDFESNEFWAEIEIADTHKRYRIKDNEFSNYMIF